MTPDQHNKSVEIARRQSRLTRELTIGSVVVCIVFMYLLIFWGPAFAAGFTFVLLIPLVTFILGPVWGFLLYFPTTFSPAIPIKGIPITLNQLAGALFIIGWLRWWWQGKVRLAGSRFLVLLIISYIYFALSALLGEDFSEGSIAFRYLTIYFVLALVIASMMTTRREVHTVAWIILLVTFCHALIGFYEFFSGIDVLVPTRAKYMGVFRINAASPTAIVFGHFLLFAFPFGYYLFSESKNPSYRLVAISLSLFILFVSILTLSRQVMIILALELFLVPLLFKNRHSKTFLIVVIICAVLLFPYASYRVIQRIQSLKIEELKRDRSLIFRTDAFIVGLKMLKANPFFGIGLGSFSTRWDEYAEFDTHIIHLEKPMRIYTDCTYNQLLAETGIVGFILALLIYIHVIAISVKKRKEAMKSENRPLINFTSIVIVLITAMLISGIVEDTFLALRTWFMYGFTLSLQKRGFLSEQEKE